MHLRTPAAFLRWLPEKPVAGLSTPQHEHGMVAVVAAVSLVLITAGQATLRERAWHVSIPGYEPLMT